MADGKQEPHEICYPTSSQILEKPLVSPSRFDEKTSQGDY